MNDLTNPPSQKLTIAYSAQAELGVELAKILMLVAPISMTAEQHELWLRSAVGALDGIRADEVRAVILELQRKVTKPAHIVPEIAELVAQHRKRSRIAAVSENDRCRCGRGMRARTGRTDVHWIKEDGRSRIEFCETAQ